ncbi:hypothetical protein LJC20_03670 [Eubacteriales bacterium OttesenSCG-928-M02]|nr:hypothetical protein [Eubacteriales bacterium OttesenSCG-928-M02]
MKRILNRLGHNWGLKLAALFFAILLWSYVVTEEDPARTRTYTEIPIEVVEMGALEQKGLAIKGDVSNIFGEAKVAVSIKMSEMSGFDASMITVNADLSEIDTPGTKTVQLTAHSSIGDVVRVTPQAVTIEVEALETTELEIQVVKEGTISENYYALDPVVNPATLTVKGAASDIAAIERAEVRLNQDGLTGNYSQQLEVSLKNESGEEINYKRFFSERPKVDVSMTVLPTKSIAIDADVEILDRRTIPWGYEITGIEILPKSIEIAGEATALEGVNSLKVNGVQVRGSTGPMLTVKAAVILPEGLIATQTKEVDVIIRIERVAE